MALVRIPPPSEFPPEMQAYLAGSRDWFKIDFVPQMSRVIALAPEFQQSHGRASRRTMADGVLSRKQKEMLAGVVSAMNACPY
jgi:hypothetical protein